MGLACPYPQHGFKTVRLHVAWPNQIEMCGLRNNGGIVDIVASYSPCFKSESDRYRDIIPRGSSSLRANFHIGTLLEAWLRHGY